MNDRIHACMDGELSRDALSAAEAAELREMEEALAMATVSLRSAPVPDFTKRVMTALPEPRQSALVRLRDLTELAWQWLWSPRQVAVRPMYLFGGAVAAMLLMLTVQSPAGEWAESPVAAAEAPSESPPELYVQFRLDAEGVNTVSLAGSFTDWEPRYELRQIAPGTWTATVALEPGVHDYLFVVDGEEWIADPTASPVDDGFGGTNSRLFLTPPASRT
jgi:hypothetical protein